ncbi:MAG: DUF4838 domain-containing protein [Kiritimatiellae bacterium]|nr:DUF4838 domain-containing protein [Kiritimatiellia bacterium]
MMKQLTLAVLLLAARVSPAGADTPGTPPAAGGGRPVAVIGQRSEKYPTTHAIVDRIAAQEGIASERHAWLHPKDYPGYAVVFMSDNVAPGDIEAGRWDEPGVPALVDRYVREGGVIVLEASAFDKIARDAEADELVSLLGFRGKSGGVAPHETVKRAAAVSPVTAHLGQTRYAWGTQRSCTLKRLTAATVLVETLDKGQPVATVHAIGRGRIFWFASPLHLLLAKATKAGLGAADGDGVFHESPEARDAEAYRQMLVAAVETGNPARSAIPTEKWEANPLGAPVPGNWAEVNTNFPADYKEKTARREHRAQAAGRPVVLIRNGAPKASIVLPPDPTEDATRCATVLLEHVRAMSGASLPVLTVTELGPLDASPTGCKEKGVTHAEWNFVLLGAHAFLDKLGVTPDALGPEGMVVKTAGNTVVLAGKDGSGLRHATYELLDILGCRYLWPGELGKVIPRRETVLVPPTDIAEAPRLWQRYVRSVRPEHKNYQSGLAKLGFALEEYTTLYKAATHTEQVDSGYYAWHKMGSHRKIHRGHSFGSYWKQYGAEHPDWFALQPNGSRDQSRAAGRPRLCHSNEALIRAIIRNKLAELEKNPEQEGVGIGLNDGSYTTMCLCENCRKLDPANARPITLTDFTAARRPIPYVALTDRVLRFSNRIAQGLAQEYPDKHLGFYAYSCYKTPPLTVEPHRNLIIFFVDGHYQDEQARLRALNDWAQWTRFGNKLFWRPNALYANRYKALPQNFARKLFRDFKYLYNTQLVGTDFDGGEQHWALKGLVYYVLAKAHWNPNQLDYDAIVEDYCRAGFGPAADAVAAYFAALEKMTDRAAAQKTGLMRQYAEQDFANLHGLLDRAKEAASDPADGEVLTRVRFLERGLALGELQWRAEQQPGKHEAAFLALLRDTAREFTLAVNAPYIASHLR